MFGRTEIGGTKHDETNRYGVLDVPDLRQAGGGGHVAFGLDDPAALPRGGGPEVGAGLPAPASEPVGAGASPGPVPDPVAPALAPVGRPGAAEVEAWVRATWPADQERAVRVARCESGLGQHRATYDLDAENAGPLQINRGTWQPYFQAHYGWSWADVAGIGPRGLEVHFLAAREVYDRGGGWAPWTCRG